jgi:hypothetical protein
MSRRIWSAIHMDCYCKNKFLHSFNPSVSLLGISIRWDFSPPVPWKTEVFHYITIAHLEARWAIG